MSSATNAGAVTVRRGITYSDLWRALRQLPESCRGCISGFKTPWLLSPVARLFSAGTCFRSSKSSGQRDFIGRIVRVRGRFFVQSARSVIQFAAAAAGKVSRAVTALARRAFGTSGGKWNWPASFGGPRRRRQRPRMCWWWLVQGRGPTAGNAGGLRVARRAGSFSLRSTGEKKEFGRAG